MKLCEVLLVTGEGFTFLYPDNIPGQVAIEVSQKALRFSGLLNIEDDTEYTIYSCKDFFYQLTSRHKELKYTRTRLEESYSDVCFGSEIYVFPKQVCHYDFYRALMICDWDDLYRGEIESAGFTNLITCYGRSETLKVDSSGVKDTELLKISLQENLVLDSTLL